MNGDSLEAIEPWMAGLLAKVEPRQRARAMTRLMQMVRRANAKRISANREPDGGAMAARKKRPSLRDRHKSGKMFRRIGKASALKVRVTADEGQLTFANPGIEKTAAEHHYGLTGFVGKTRPSRDKPSRIIRARYTARRLLGFGDEADDFLDELLKHLDLD